MVLGIYAKRFCFTPKIYCLLRQSCFSAGVETLHQNAEYLWKHSHQVWFLLVKWFKKRRVLKKKLFTTTDDNDGHKMMAISN